MALGERFEEVLAAAQEGADWAWALLYDDLAPSLLGFLRGRVGHHADDLLGEVFVQLARNLVSFEGREPAFRGWVFKIAHHRVIDHWRRRSRRPADATDAAALVRHVDAGRTGDAEAEALAALETQEMLDLLDGLTDDQRTVLTLRILADFSLDDVAAVMGRKTNAVKALQNRAFKQLRKRLERAVTRGDVTTVEPMT
jgi:RNA polymerase sigma-70 factor (ECF subfamily)